MQDDLRDAFEGIKNELRLALRHWIMYQQLFEKNAHRREVINRTARDLFVQFQWLVADHMILTFSRLTDPAKSGRNGENRNRSLSYLLEEVEASGNLALVTQLKPVLAALCPVAAKFRTIRNKRIAHSDLVVSLKSKQSPLPGVSRAEISGALKSVAEFLNLIELAYFNSIINYEKTTLPLKSDGRALLIWLQKGLAYKQLADEGRIDRQMWRELGNIDARTPNN